MTEDESSGFIDSGAEYSPKSEFSKPMLTYMAFEKCIAARAKEMKRGYYNTTVSKEGLPLKTWIEDSRKVYCSAVQALKMTLWPELLADENYKDIDLDEVWKKYCYYIYEEYKGEDGKRKYRRTKENYMPEIDSLVDVRHILPTGEEKMVAIANHWNNKVDAYWYEMVRKCDLIYKELMRVIHRLNYFKRAIRFG